MKIKLKLKSRSKLAHYFAIYHCVRDDLQMLMD
jgi:hypothetical protein